jgi:hypothetical protein
MVHLGSVQSPVLRGENPVASISLTVILAGIVGSAFLLFGAVQWPGLHWDACFFGTPVISVATGKGWIFGGAADALIAYESRAYEMHGLLHVLFFGELLKVNTWEKLYFVCGVVNFLTFLVWTFLFEHELRRSKIIVRAVPIVAIGGGLIAGVICLGLQGRPEQLCPILISLPFLGRAVGIPDRIVERALFFLSGILAVASPASGIVMSTGLVYWVSMRFEGRSQRAFLLRILEHGLFAILAVLLVASLCPVSIKTWIERLTNGQGKAPLMVDRLFRLLPRGLMGISIDAPLWNVTILTTFWMVVTTLYRQRKFVGLILFLCPAAYLWPKLTDYGYAPFIPMILLYFLGASRTAAECSERWFSVRAMRQYFGVCAGLYFICFLRIVLLTLLYVREGTTLAKAREQLRELGALQYGVDRSVTVFGGWTKPSFIVFGDAGDSFLIGVPSRDGARRDEGIAEYCRRQQRHVDYFILPQKNLGAPDQKLWIGDEECSLVFNGWDPAGAAIFGVPLWGPKPGYQFALYRRTSKAAD